MRLRRSAGVGRDVSPVREPDRRHRAPVHAVSALVPLAELELEAGEGTDVPLAVLEDLELEVRRLIAAGIAPHTRRAYLSTARIWSAWATAHGFDPWPASERAVALWVADYGATRSVSTVRRHLAALASLHRAREWPDPSKTPAVRAVMRGLRRTRGEPSVQVHAITVLELDAMARAAVQRGSPARSTRDRALLLLGFGGAFRRGELAALDWTDLRWDQRGLEVTIRRSKADQEGRGQRVAVPYAARFPELCPVTAIATWSIHGGQGAVFRRIKGDGLGSRLSPRAVAEVVRRLAARAGLEGRVSGHSMRAGWATAAAAAGASGRAIRRHGRWRTTASADRYVRDAERWADHPGAQIL